VFGEDVLVCVCRQCAECVKDVLVCVCRQCAECVKDVLVCVCRQCAELVCVCRQCAECVKDVLVCVCRQCAECVKNVLVSVCRQCAECVKDVLVCVCRQCAECVKDVLVSVCRQCAECVKAADVSDSHTSDASQPRRLRHKTLIREPVKYASTYLQPLHMVITTTTTQLFYGGFSGTTRMSRCQERTSGLYGATLWCKGRLTQADTPTIRPSATPSGLTSAHLHLPPIFLQAGCPSCRPTNSVKHTEGNRYIW